MHCTDQEQYKKKRSKKESLSTGSDTPTDLCGVRNRDESNPTTSSILITEFRGPGLNLATGSTMSVRVVVHKNEPGAIGKIVVVKNGMEWNKLKALAGKKLGIRAKRVFQANGAEIENLVNIQNNDQLYVSDGPNFFKEAFNRRGIGKGEESYCISVLGTGGVGKSALTLRFIRDIFVEEWDPTIEDAYRKTVEVDSQMCSVEILDTAGQDDFLSLRPQWMIDKDAYVFVYSMCSKNSLHELEHFFELHQQINAERNVPIIMVANKKDLKPSKNKEWVSTEEGKNVAEKYGAQYYETSAYSGENVELVFKQCVRDIRKGKAPLRKPSTPFFSFCVVL